MSGFVDAPPGRVGEIVEKLREEGFVVGRSLNPPMFYPYSPMTRAEICVLIVRGKHGAGYAPPAASEAPFPDVRSDYWGAKWIARAASDGLALPQLDGKFYPTSPATRMDVAVLFGTK